VAEILTVSSSRYPSRSRDAEECRASPPLYVLLVGDGEPECERECVLVWVGRSGDGGAIVVKTGGWKEGKI
jgi:hypothetical protein